MGEILNTTNTVIAIITGCISIISSIAGVLGKKNSALYISQYESPRIQAQVREWWSGFSLIWRIWLGIFFSIFFTVTATVVADALINGGVAAYLSGTQHGFVEPDFSNSVVFIISAIFGMLFGVSAGVSIATGEGTEFFRPR
jgi:hypothetical protein